jgi:anti-sigma factor RsiW
VNADLTCATCHDALPGYVAGTLAPVDALAVEQHLASCAACQHDLAGWQKAAAMARALDAMVPPASASAAHATWTTLQAQLASESPMAMGDLFMDFDSQPNGATPMQSPRAASARQQRSPARRVSPLMASIAATLVIVLAAAIFALRPHSMAPTVGSGKTTTAIPPTPTFAVTPLNATSAVVLSASNIWIAKNGVTHPNSNNATDTAQLVNERYDGKQWLGYPGVSLEHAELQSLSMDSAQDGWAVGVTGFTHVPYDNGDPVPLVLHTSGGAWTQMTIPFTNLTLTQVQALAPDDVWVVGAPQTGSSVVFHYTNGAWTQVPFNSPAIPASALAASTGAALSANTQPLSSGPAPNTLRILQLQMVSGTEGWALGVYQNQSVIWQYRNGQWSVAQHANTSQAQFLGLGVNSATDVWALGTTPASTTGNASGGTSYAAMMPDSTGGHDTLYHYDGHAWTSAPAAAGAESPFLAGGEWLPIYTLMPPANTSVSISGMLHLVNGATTGTSLPSRVQSMLGVGRLADGSSVALAMGDANAPDALHVFRYANGGWSTLG